MITGPSLEVLLAAGYAVFLVGIAIVLEMVARHSHRRSERYRNSGFFYKKHLDVWECPAGRHLTRERTDLERKIAHYRASAHHCNHCTRKTDCTDSEDGRRLESHLESWLQSEMSRFHRGISLALILLALIILTVEIFRHGDRQDWIVLASLWLPIAFYGFRYLKAFLQPVTHGKPRSTAPISLI
jgi:cation transport ATPase